jgi:hypothetical protein
MRPGSVGSDGIPVTAANRRLALQVVALVFFLWTLACLVAAVIVGGPAFIIGSAINFMVSAVALAYVGLPRGYWRYWVAIWRR